MPWIYLVIDALAQLAKADCQAQVSKRLTKDSHEYEKEDVHDVDQAADICDVNDDVGGQTRMGFTQTIHAKHFKKYEFLLFRAIGKWIIGQDVRSHSSRGHVEELHLARRPHQRSIIDEKLLLRQHDLVKH